MRKYYYLFLMLCTLTKGQSKVFVYELPSIIEAQIELGYQCLKEKKQSCTPFFERALELADSLETDSIRAMTYFEICTAIDYEGKEEDRVAYAQRGIEELNGKKHPTVTSRLFLEIGSSFHRQGLVNELDSIYQKAMEWARIANDNSTIAFVYIQWAGGIRRTGNIKKAIELLLEGEPYAAASGDAHRVNGITFALANAYSSNDDLANAREYYTKAVEGFRTEDPDMYIRAIVNRAMTSISLGYYEEAIQSLPEAIVHFETHEPNLVIYPQTQLGRAYAKQGDCEKAIPILKASFQKSKAIDNAYIHELSGKLLSKCYLDQDSPEVALQYSEPVYQAEKARGYSDGYLTAFEQHAAVLKANGRFEESLAVYEAWAEAKDSLFNENKQKEIAALQAFYEAEQKAQQIVLLEKEVRLGRLQRGLLGLGLLAAVLLFGLVYLRFRERAKRAQIEKEKLDAELNFKKKELTTHALHLAKKNEVLNSLKEKVEDLSQGRRKNYREIINTIDFDLRDEANWQQFTQYFDQVHQDFSKKAQLQYPKITNNDLRFMALLRMNLSSKEIANLLNITPDGVKKTRQRLRKKMELSTRDSLEAKVIAI